MVRRKLTINGSFAIGKFLICLRLTVWRQAVFALAAVFAQLSPLPFDFGLVRVYLALLLGLFTLLALQLIANQCTGAETQTLPTAAPAPGRSTAASIKPPAAAAPNTPMPAPFSRVVRCRRRSRSMNSAPGSTPPKCQLVSMTLPKRSSDSAASHCKYYQRGANAASNNGRFVVLWD